MSTNGKIRHLWLLQFFADFAALVAAYYTALLIRFHSEVGEKFYTAVNQMLRARETGALDDMFEDFYIGSAFRIVALIMMTLCVLYGLRDLYSGRRFIRPRPVAWDIIVANVSAIALFFTYFYLQRNIFHPRSYFLTVIFFNIIYCIWFRSLIDRLLNFLRARLLIDNYNAILIGTGEAARIIETLVTETLPHGIIIIDRMPGDASGAGFEPMLVRLEEKAVKYGANMVIAADPQFSMAQIMRILEIADRMKMSAKILSDKLDVLMSRARISADIIHNLPLVHFEAPARSDKTTIGRNLFPIILAILGLIVLSPLMLIITMLVRLTSRGPAVFVQERIGVNRKPFMMYKFRTMYNRAEELQAQVEEFNESGAGLFKIRNDPRITPVGRFLRRFSLDELPQLFNVIRGEMTIVGPRPLPWRDFQNYYEEWHYSRHAGLPGLTCLWQVSGRSDLDFHNMCILDVYYLWNRNWVLDLRIILKTFWVVLFAKGAY